MVTSRAAETSTLLQGYQCLNLTTFRKNDMPVVTTVWFALANNKIYVWTAKKSGKVKRICSNPAVELAPSTHLGQSRGPAMKASARILSALEQPVAEQLMNTKYGWQKQFFALIWRLKGQEHIYIEITPVEE
jgi:PPOX class probable F420-dependent enzyme